MIKRLFVKKKDGYNVAEKKLFNDITNVLGAKVSDVKIYIRYDIQGLDGDMLVAAKNTIFGENPVEV